MFSHPERLLWLIPFLMLAWYGSRAYRPPLGVPRTTWERLGRESRPGRMRTVAFLRWLALIVWVVAWAEPRWGMERIRVERSAYDIVFAVDCSRSMLAEDLPPSRKLAARQELSDLMKRLEGNRFGLVGFADQAFVFCPLTRDTSAATLFLEQLEENAFPRQGTNLSDALKTAGSLFGDNPPVGTSIIILLSDGEDPRSRPVEVAKRLKKRGIIVHTVALGKPEGAPIPEPNGGFHRDLNDKVVMSKADEKLLREIAATTGGRSFRLASGLDHLDVLVNAIKEQDRRKLEAELIQRKRHQYFWFVGLGMALLGLAQLLVPRVRGKV